MASVSPVVAQPVVRSREVIGVDQFSQRREVFVKEDSVVPLPSPILPPAIYDQSQTIITSNIGKTTANFKRNSPAYSSMRETRTEENNIEFRPRKYSDNYTSELNQSDDVDYRRSMTERTRRLSKLRREFLNSTLHEPTNTESPFARTGVRASLPARSVSVNYKIEIPKIHKFPFAEPYRTPTPTRKVIVDFGSDGDEEKGKENQDPEAQSKHKSYPVEESKTIDNQKLFEELMKRYSPQRKPIDWKLPPTKPKVVGSLKKSTNLGSDENIVFSGDNIKKSENDDVFMNNAEQKNGKHSVGNNATQKDNSMTNKSLEIQSNGIDSRAKLNNERNEVDSRTSLTELAEKNDKVPELKDLSKTISAHKRPTIEEDLSVPQLLERITADGEELESHLKHPKKIKKKRSFLDKLLGRNKNKN